MIGQQLLKMILKSHLALAPEMILEEPQALEETLKTLKKHQPRVKGEGGKSPTKREVLYNMSWEECVDLEGLQILPDRL